MGSSLGPLPCTSPDVTWTQANVGERILLSAPLQSWQNGWWAQNPDPAVALNACSRGGALAGAQGPLTPFD